MRAQAKSKWEQAKAEIAQRREELLGRVREASPKQAVSSSSQAMASVRRNPLPPAVVVAMLLGFLMGRRRGPSA